MTAYLVRRTLGGIVTLFCVILITFSIVRVTGDPARIVLGAEATPKAVAEFRAMHGLDQPILKQLADYFIGVLHGDLGTSLRYQQPAMRLFMERLPATLQLGVSAYVVSVVVGVAGGAFTAVHAGSIIDRIGQVLVLIGQAIPGFYLGLLLIIAVAVDLRWFPTGGIGDVRNLVLPTITLSSHLVAIIFRFSRSAMLDVLHEDYIRTAQAKGLKFSTVVARHALRNALIPLLTVLALQSSVIFSGAIVTETVFSWPGIGRFAVDALLTRDYPVVQAVVLVSTVIVVVLNLAVDLAYGYLDPRIRYS